MTKYFGRFVCIAVFLFIGCSSADPAGDVEESDRLRNVLTTALDAWQAGEAATLAGRETPIRFVDDDWAAGRQLVAYELEDPDALVSPFETVFVSLTLQTGDGKTIERKVGYQVSMTPSFAVLRSEP